MAETLTKPSTSSPDASGDRDKSRGRSSGAQENLQGLEKVFVPYEGFLGTSASKEQLRRSVAEPVQTAPDDLAAETGFLDALLGTSMLEPPIERHAEIMSDPRFSHPANAPTSSRIVNRLHQTYGNAHVQRVTERIPMMHLTEQTGSDMESRSVIQRWGPGDHSKLTQAGAKKAVAKIPGFVISNENLRFLKSASTDMDFRSAEILFNIGGKRRQGQHKRLVEWYEAHEGNALNHGEGGLYKMDKAAEINKEHQKAMENRAKFKTPMGWNYTFDDLFKRDQMSAMSYAMRDLGDALHVAQDRGSHGEGTKGMGHDHPDTKYNCDDPGQNDLGYKDAGTNTDEVMNNRGALFLVSMILAKNVWVARKVRDYLKQREAGRRARRGLRKIRRLQRTYGNGHVQRVVDLVQAAQDEGLSDERVSGQVEQTIDSKRAEGRGQNQ